MRLWYEVNSHSICYDAQNHKDAEQSRRKWFPYNKGGGYRKWYGNNDYLINWGHNGAEIKAYGHLVPRSMKYMFLPSITWSKISTNSCAFRYKPQGTMFDVAGLSMFAFDADNQLYLMGLCNSKFSQMCLSILSPTMNFETGHIAAIPVVESEEKTTVCEIVRENINASKNEWDSFEVSWDFKKHPLI